MTRKIKKFASTFKQSWIEKKKRPKKSWTGCTALLMTWSFSAITAMAVCTTICPDLGISTYPMTFCFDGDNHIRIKSPIHWRNRSFEYYTHQYFVGDNDLPMYTLLLLLAKK
mmetsp:Transcript_6891/g.16810  ORF Transcript_6891/g.16810 Transcript_6891/m.16810 type:complete len:112 (+) Transcript_6891:118-453(+)